MRIRREVVGALCALLVTACAAAAAGPGDDSSTSVPPMVGGVGVLPEPLATAGSLPLVTDSSTTSTPPTSLLGTTTTDLHVAGNRVLVLGDSITASTSSRYTNDMCKALVPLGWQVEVEAEVSRGIDFGNTVLAKRMSAGWDLGVVFLGTNNGGTDGNEYLKQLNKIITTFAPSPVVLVTVGQFRPEMKGINDTIRAIAGVYPDRVRIVDWNHLTEVYPTILSDDGIHPTVAGRQVLAQAIASELGQAPTSPGDCLPSVFTDDSAGSVDGKSGSGNTGTTVRPRSTQSTVPKETPTTVKGGGSNTTTTVKPVTVTTTVGGGGSGTTLAPTGPTTPPATYGTVGTTAAPQQTAPPAPPTTAAPGP